MGLTRLSNTDSPLNDNHVIHSQLLGASDEISLTHCLSGKNSLTVLCILRYLLISGIHFSAKEYGNSQLTAIWVMIRIHFLVCVIRLFLSHLTYGSPKLI